MLEADTVRAMGEIASRGLHGRRQIFTSVSDINSGNVIDVLNEALQVHQYNREDEIYLKKYIRGIQPILLREKKVNGEINNKVVVNLADQIVSFKTAEFAGEPITYISRKGANDKVPEKVASINSMMLSEGKQTKDIELAHDMFVNGLGYRLVIHDRGRNHTDYLDEAPFEIYIPNPENTFVVRLNDVTKRVVMGVTYVFRTAPESDVEYTVYTDNVTYVIRGVGGKGMEIVSETHHNFGMVTLIEYPCNPLRMGAFENVLPLLDAINTTQSNRLDGVEQFIQALMVFEGVDIDREQFLELKDLGAIKLPPAMDGRTSRVYYLNDQLDQAQTQTLVNDMYNSVLRIVGMPSQGDANTGDSSNNGATIMKNGWWHAEARALETQGMWKEAETQFLKIVLKICNESNVLSGLKVSEIEPKFWRQTYEDLLVKTQSFSTLRAAGMPSVQAFTFSHISKDPESDSVVFDAYQEELAQQMDAESGVDTGGDSTKSVSSSGSTRPSSGVSGSQGTVSEGRLRHGNISGSGHPRNETAVCPVCKRTFQKRANNQVYDRAECREKAEARAKSGGGAK